ncbi:MAG: D-glycero-beta-D-manno-heptose 1-phosphate adenylyltransferase [Candidatus Baltobacteraceae bacterium]
MPTPDFLFGRVLEMHEALAYRHMLGARNKRVVFTNGCFDILHVGHAEYLAWARAQGDALIVGLNGDASVRELKGSPRPFVPFEQRARLLCALRSVDAVIGFEERTPEKLLDRLRPDIHVKSAQYRIDDLPEARIVTAYGGEVRLAPHVEGTSTTDIVERVRAHFPSSG